MQARLAVLEEIAATNRVAFAELRTDMREMRSELAATRSELRSENLAVRGELHQEILGIRADMAGLRTDYRWLLGLMLGAAGATLAVVAHGFHWF